jgi:hypothetical protein
MDNPDACSWRQSDAATGASALPLSNQHRARFPAVTRLPARWLPCLLGAASAPVAEQSHDSYDLTHEAVVSMRHWQFVVWRVSVA